MGWLRRLFGRPPAVPSNLPPFFMRSDGEAVVCHECKKLGGALPLPHPAIIIPTRPQFVQPGPDDKIKAPKWSYFTRAYCVRHARKVLRRMRDDDLTPGAS